MKVPCEHAIWYILPQIRSDIAKELVSGGMSQKEAAKRLGVTPAAVSQYLNKKRANTEKKGKVYYEAVKTAGERIRDMDDDSAISNIICELCNACQKNEIS